MTYSKAYTYLCTKSHIIRFSQWYSMDFENMMGETFGIYFLVNTPRWRDVPVDEVWIRLEL
jgi:hypothetical protein